MGLVALSQAFGFDGFRLLATIQSVTPYLVPVVAVPAGAAVWRRWHGVGVVAALVGLALLVLAFPIAFPPDPGSPGEGAGGTRVAAVNLLYANSRTSEVADVLARRDLDTIVFTEYTPAHRDVLLAHRLADDLPYRQEIVRDLASGIAVWSRYPLTVAPPPDTLNPTVDLVLDGGDGPFRLVAVHPPTPIYGFDRWKAELGRIAEIAGASTSPTLLIGDFNASYWHPVFRKVLGRGFTDAHTVLGHGLSMSWPADRPFPPFVRLDHALTNDTLVAMDVEDFRVPGSDHVGLVVTVAPAD